MFKLHLLQYELCETSKIHPTNWNQITITIKKGKKTARWEWEKSGRKSECWGTFILCKASYVLLRLASNRKVLINASNIKTKHIISHLPYVRCALLRHHKYKLHFSMFHFKYDYGIRHDCIYRNKKKKKLSKTQDNNNERRNKLWRIISNENIKRW